MPKEIQVKAADGLENMFKDRSVWTRRDNGKTIVFTHTDGSRRYVVKPIHTNLQRKHSREVGGGWFNVKSYYTKLLAKRA